jgi:gas vesicle protein
MHNSCQDTPSGPCPDSCCDETVRYSIYDVFVCPSCDQVRADIEKASGRMVVSRNTTMNSQAKAKAKSAKKSDLSKTVSKTSNGQHKETVSTPPLDDGQPNKQVLPNKEAAGKRSDDNSDIDGSDCCPHCLIQLSGKRQLRCDICSSIYHQRCTQMNSKVFDKFITNIADIGWVCNDCKQTARSTFRRLEAAISQLAEELAAVKIEMSSVKCDLLN